MTHYPGTVPVLRRQRSCHRNVEAITAWLGVEDQKASSKLAKDPRRQHIA